MGNSRFLLWEILSMGLPGLPTEIEEAEQALSERASLRVVARRCTLKLPKMHGFEA